MTRFKELQRLRLAIRHKNPAELKWAIGYCQMRIELASQFGRKSHETTWKGLEKAVRAAILQSESEISN